MSGCLLCRYQQMLTVHLHDFLNRRQLLRLELKAYILAQYSSEYNFLIHMCISQASAKSVLLLYLVTKTLQDSKPKKAQTPCFGVVGFFSCAGSSSAFGETSFGTNISLSDDCYNGERKWS